MGDVTDRLAIPYMEGTDLANTIDEGFQDLAERLDAIAVEFSSGTLAARPTSTPASPGVEGRVYRATDTGQVFYDRGTGWELVSQRPLGTGANDAAAGNDARLSDQRVPTDGSVTTSKIADLAVITGKLAASAVTAAKLAGASVSQEKLSDALLGALGLGATRRGFAEVTTEESTATTTAFVDLATPGPEVTVNVPVGGLVFAMAEARAVGNGSQVGMIGLRDKNGAAVPTGNLSSMREAAIIEKDATGSLLTRFSAPGSSAPAGSIWRGAGGVICIVPEASGNRTYKLVYTAGTYSHRKLWVWTMGGF